MGYGSQRKNGASHVYGKLKHLLVNYQFTPAKQLHPNDLADQLRVSSTPVREALHRLSGEHLLDCVPNKGFFAKILCVDEMRELLVLTHVLLQHAVSVVVLPPKGSDFARYAAQADGRGLEQVDLGLTIALFMEDVFEHVASLSTNRSLVTIIKNLNDRTHYVRSLEVEAAEHGREVLAQVQRFVEQVRDHKTPEAMKNLHEQLQNTLGLMPALVKEGLARSYDASAFDLGPGGGVVGANSRMATHA